MRLPCSHSPGLVLAVLSALLCSACSARRDASESDPETAVPPTEVRGVRSTAPDAPAQPAERSDGTAVSAGSSAPAPEPFGRASLGDTPLPCAVDRVLETSCRGCHASEPGLLAPMALVTLEDLTASAVSDPHLRVHELAARRVHDDVAPMPPPSSRRLTADELAVLDDFFDDARASEPDDGCADAQPPADSELVPMMEPPDDVGECYQLRAHDREVAGDHTPFRVASGEYYSCFYFGVPWPEGAQAVTIRSLDTPRVHHWQLYHVIEPHTDGQITREAPDCGYDLREALGVYSHSEEREQRMPEGVGLRLPPPGDEHGLLLEIHYYNPGEETDDDTGVEVCTARAPRPHVAGISGLGPSYFALPPGKTTEVSSVCTPAAKQDMHVFRSFPHMHARGVRMETVIARADGTREVLMDVPFDFDNQLMFDTPAVIHPGDQLITTCHYLNDTAKTIYAGFAVDSEMCNHFVYEWPAGGISNGTIDGLPTFCAF